MYKNATKQNINTSWSLKHFSQDYGSSFSHKKQNRFEILSNLLFRCEEQLFRLEMEFYVIHMTTVADLTVPAFDYNNFHAFFQVYGLVSRQWYHECWPLKTLLSLVCRHDTFL